MIEVSGVRSINRGFALPAVAFLIVIVALIIAALERINSNQTATSSMGLQSSRAYYATYSGVEWAAYQVINNNACPATGSIGSGIQGFTISLESCTQSPYKEGSSTDNVFIYEIRVLATYGGQGQLGVSPDFASRELTVSMMIEN
ncbi:hypothetical protein ACFOEK_15075 [Litoribrevibacter euphylliae]|uniref:MSHA biogenesis protein MshP n=1 Tax=Litoribrevibacter euphylliae TaxID=1834034 RepID=A0ABV7HES6_9GAMM